MAKTKQQILADLFQWEGIDTIIDNITSKNSLAEELKQELFLILMEMSDTKIQRAYNERWLNYLAINIITKMWKSKTSPFYKKFRANKNDELKDWTIFSDDNDEFDYDTLKIVLEQIEKLPYVEKELLKMRYKLDEYDKYFGEKKDNFCKKSVYSYRKMEQKLKIGDISIDHNTIQKYHWKAIGIIKNKLHT